MSPAPNDKPAPLTLDRLRLAFPEYEITEDPGFKPPKYHAVALHLDTSPSVVITDDLAEMAATLSSR